MSKGLKSTVLITGASRGIGAATARVFADAGWNVVLMARSGDAIREIAAEIGDAAIAVAGDVADAQDVTAAVDQAVAHFGGLTCYIANAGVIEPVRHLIDADPTAWGHVIDVNLKGVFYGMRAAGQHMAQNGGGTFITISSGAAYNPMEGWSHYCASKAGALMLTRSLDLECRDKGIRALGLSPGTVATQMQREIKASGMNPVSTLEWTDHIPPEWPARTLLWMCSPSADPWLGQDISLRQEEIREAVGLI